MRCELVGTAAAQSALVLVLVLVLVLSFSCFGLDISVLPCQPIIR